MRVLVADDDSSTRHLLWRLLTDWGHDVVVVSDAEEAWAVLRQPTPPHIAILDRGLPKGGGLGLCRLVRDFNLRQQMHIIVSTSVVDSPALVKSFESGADDLIAKPFDINELHRRVNEGCREVAGRLTQTGTGPCEAFEIVPPPQLPLDAPAGLVGPASPALPTADERPLLALARLGQRAVEGARMGDFARLVAGELSDGLGAQSVRVFVLGAKGESILRAEAGTRARGEDKAPRQAHPLLGEREVAVSFGSEQRPEGSLVVEVSSARALPARDRELIAGAGHLLGLVAQRERLEQQIGQAQRMEVFGHLAGGVAHDFNNVLAVVGSSAATLESLVDGDGEALGELSLIGRAVERGRMLSDRLLSFGRTPAAAAGVIELNETVFSARGVLERLLQGRVGITTELEPRPLLIHADRSEIEQVLVNLVLNARDACEKGGDVVIRTTHTSGAASGGVGQVSFSIIDQGSGMAERTRQHMFDPFFSTKAPGDGAGVGLSTVQEIVQRGDGKVEVDSAIGCGTTVTVHWPCASSKCCTYSVSGAA